jgi:hypothetical protein
MLLLAGFGIGTGLPDLSCHHITKRGKYAKDTKILPKIYQNIPKYTKIYQNIPKYTKIYQNIPKYTQNIPKI